MKLTYRPEIDGLRAIAIIFIVLSHFKQLNFVSGGVNIFFVISGYLISHILVNQKIDLIKFYKIRFLKLYPQIFLIASLTILLFLFFGDFTQWIIILRSFVSTIIGLFNFYLIKIGDVYGQQNFINPFLPFWAFCVIIQFYLVFPFILKIIFFVKKKLNLKEDFITVSLLFISLVLFLVYYFYKDNLLFNFYSPLSRYWQFLLGSCLYFLVKSKKQLYFNNLSIYIAIIFIIIWQLNFEWFYAWRKVQILLTITTILFLYSTKPSIFNQILSVKPLTYLGKISYSLYLIHMPVIYFISIWFEQGVFLISLISISLITYFLENFNNTNLYKQIIKFLFENKIIIFLLFLSLSFSNIYLFKKEKEFYNLSSRINIIENKIINLDKGFQRTYREVYDLVIGNYGRPCFNNKLGDGFLENCSFIQNQNNKNFFIVGGSQISTLTIDLKNRLKDFNYYQFTSSGFIYLPDFHYINTKDSKKNSDFFERNKFIKTIILSANKESIVLIGTRLPLYINKTGFDNLEGGIEEVYINHYFEHIENLEMKWEDGFKNSIKELLNNKNIKIILVYPIPEVGFDIVTKLINHKFFSNTKNAKYDTSYKVFKDRTKSSFELLDSIQEDNIYRVYPHTLFCDTIIKDRCIVHDDKNIFYSDDDHPSIKGAEMINELIMKEIKKIELKSN